MIGVKRSKLRRFTLHLFNEARFYNCYFLILLQYLSSSMGCRTVAIF